MFLEKTVIEYDNVFSKVICKNMSIIGFLYKGLTVRDKGYFWMKQRNPLMAWDGNHRFFNRVNNSFPSGLLPQVIQILKLNKVPYSIVGNIPKKIEYKNYTIEGVDLRDYQIDSVKACCNFGRGVIELATGAGKSEIICSMIKEFNVTTLVIVHMKSLFINIYDRLQKRLNVPIGKITADETDLQFVTVAMIPTLNNKLAVFENYLNKVNLIIADETHHASCKTWYNCLIKCPASYRFGFSATPLKDNDLQNYRLKASIGNVIYSKRNHEMINRGVLAVPEVRVLAVPYNKEFGSYRDNYEYGIVKCEPRNELIKKVCIKHVRGILILVNRIEHGTILNKMIARSAFLHGKSEDLRYNMKRFENNEIDVLIATSIFDEGVDIKGINVLILAVGMSSRTKLLQRVGRGLRKKANNEKIIIYDFKDNINFLRKHFNIRKKIFIAEQFQIIDNYKL